MLFIRAARYGFPALVAAVLVTFTAAPGAAQTATQPAGSSPPSNTPVFFRNIQFGGLADGYYDYNSLKPDGDALYRNFDTKYNKARFSMAQLWAVKGPTADSRIGFNVKLSVGHANDMIHASEPSSNDFLNHMEQLYVSYLAPVGKGLQIDAGKFVTQHGAEVIEARDNWNYSRSLLFALAIPYYHAGVRATYTANDKLSFMGTVVNGWNDVKDNNGAKTFGAQVTVKPVPQLAIVQNYMVGAEQPHNTDDVRHLFDTVVSVTASPKVSVMANYDYGKDSLAGAGVSWQGLAGYLKVQAKPWLAVIPRVEWFTDPDGFMTGTSQTLKDATITGEFKLRDQLLWRVEYRRDMSDTAVFIKNTGARVDSQNTFGVAILYAYTFTTK
jgi:hypothetical protein